MEGFLSQHMHGFVCPISKVKQKEVPQPFQTRPIVVLPQIYRLWAAVQCSLVIQALCRIIPAEVNGLLPNRGAVTAAYQAQFRTECSRFFCTPLSGLVLDLRKCFNCIAWRFAFHALCALGVPVKLLIPGILSQRALTKHWLISGTVHTAGHSTTGFCEGGPLSILSMLGVATTWVTYPRSCTQHHFQHMQTTLMDATLRLTRAIGVELDWTKTWWWTSHPEQGNAVRMALQQAAPQLVQHKACSSDLGFQAQYSGNNQLGILQERLDKGLERISRLHSMPHCLTVKEIMLRCSIYPALFYGYEVKPPAQNVFLQVRSGG